VTPGSATPTVDTPPLGDSAAAPPPHDPLADPEFVAGLRPIPSGSFDAPAPWPARDLLGVSPSGDPMEVSVADSVGTLLLVFLHTDCDGCEEFWHGLRNPDAIGLAPGTSAVVVTKGPETLSSDVVKASAAGIQVPVVMSNRVWSDYRVLGYPFFVLVDRASSQVIGETVGLGWSDVIAMTHAASP
jgi:hypothetical protein